MATIASLIVNLIANSDRFSAGMRKGKTELTALEARLKTTQSVMSGFGAALGAMGISVSAGLILRSSIKAASDAAETASKFQVVFRDIASSAQAAADTLDKSYGLSGRASQQLLADTGDLLTGFGFSQKAALDLSFAVNKLAVDLASFTNFSGGAEGASQALTKALLGERESVKALGIAILESDVKARVALLTAQGMRFETERQAKAFATLQIAQEQSKNAIGDYARTQSVAANQAREFTAALDDLQVALGNLALPLGEKVLPALTKFLNDFNDWIKNIREGADWETIILGPKKQGAAESTEQIMKDMAARQAAADAQVAATIAAKNAKPPGLENPLTGKITPFDGASVAGKLEAKIAAENRDFMLKAARDEAALKRKAAEDLLDFESRRFDEDLRRDADAKRKAAQNAAENQSKLEQFARDEALEKQKRFGPGGAASPTAIVKGSVADELLTNRTQKPLETIAKTSQESVYQARQQNTKLDQVVAKLSQQSDAVEVTF